MRNQRKKKKNKLLICIIIICTLILIYSLGKIVMWYLNGLNSKKIIAETNKDVKVVVKEGNKEEFVVDFKALKEKNPDTVAWLKVENTDVNMPVVKTNNNDYYLNHNLEKQYSEAGWIFVDYKNNLDGTDKNIVIYGHNMLDGTMFGSLEKILTKEWQDNEANKYVTLITETEKAKYEVFSVYQIDVETYYIQTNMQESVYQEFLNKLKSRSKKDYGVTLTDKDKILTLSTCSRDMSHRIVLHAKKILNEE